MNIPEWADPELSEQLPALCASGESQTLEFKQELPVQKRDFAKSIAALATTSGGMVLVGVADDGSVIGVKGAQASSVRDELCARIAGLCQQIEPPVRPTLTWAVQGSRAVLVVKVDKGSEPLYYLDSRAYIRHATVSRPATPAEVQAAFTRPKQESVRVDSTLSELAGLLAEVLRWCDIDLQMRALKPWVDDWSFAAQYSAGKLREMAVSDWGLKDKRGERLLPLAEKLDEVDGFRHTWGSGHTFDEVCRQAAALATQLMQEFVWVVQVDEGSQAAVRSKLAAYCRQLEAMWNRAAANVFDGRVEKTQEDAATIGRQIADWTYLPLAFFGDDARLRFRRVALDLVELAALRTYSDGGESLRRLVERGRQLTDRLIELVAKLEASG